jgi:hypothetical protein
MEIVLVIIFLFTYGGMPDDNEVHRRVMFNDTNAIDSVCVFFIIKYGKAFEH